MDKRYMFRGRSINSGLWFYGQPQQTRLLQRWCNNKKIFATTKAFDEYDPKMG